MFGIYARSFMTATRTPETPEMNHWGRHTRFDTRREVELMAQTEGRRRD